VVLAIFNPSSLALISRVMNRSFLRNESAKCSRADSKGGEEEDREDGEIFHGL
jgi:hypothetical protein